MKVFETRCDRYPFPDNPLEGYLASPDFSKNHFLPQEIDFLGCFRGFLAIYGSSDCKVTPRPCGGTPSRTKLKTFDRQPKYCIYRLELNDYLETGPHNAKTVKKRPKRLLDVENSDKNLLF